MPALPRLDRDDWLSSVVEDVVDPDVPVVDPHHHLWDGPLGRYLAAQLRADAGGHRVVASVFVECHASYRPDGPEHLRPVGETEFVATQAGTADGSTIAGIVAHADLRLPLERLDEVLDAHEAAAGGRFRGIRHAGARDDEPDALTIPGRAPEGLYADPDFRRGVAHLGARGLTYDTWHYHHQNPSFLDLARSAPGTTMVLDHFGTPLGVGRFAGRRDEVYASWRHDIAAIAGCANVRAKLGGLAMPDNGFGWHERDRPPTSDEFVAAQADWYHHTIDVFTPDRCMFESNFPVDRASIGYRVLWNGMKKLAARYTPAERTRLLSGTASEVYRLTT